MYGWMLRFCLMDKFMDFMNIDGWKASAYTDAHNLK